MEVGLRWNMPIVTALAVYSRLLVDLFTTPASYTGKVNIVRTSFSGNEEKTTRPTKVTSERSSLDRIDIYTMRTKEEEAQPRPYALY